MPRLGPQQADESLRDWWGGEAIYGRLPTRLRQSATKVTPQRAVAIRLENMYARSLETPPYRGYSGANLDTT